MLKRKVHVSVLISNCKQSITSLTLLVGTTVHVSKTVVDLSNNLVHVPDTLNLSEFSEIHFPLSSRYIISVLIMYFLMHKSLLMI